jgi:hypothetical protein
LKNKLQILVLLVSTVTIIFLIIRVNAIEQENTNLKKTLSMNSNFMVSQIEASVNILEAILEKRTASQAEMNGLDYNLNSANIYSTFFDMSVYYNFGVNTSFSTSIHTDFLIVKDIMLKFRDTNELSNEDWDKLKNVHQNMSFLSKELEINNIYNLSKKEGNEKYSELKKKLDEIEK